MSEIQNNIGELTEVDILEGIKLFESEGENHPKSLFYDLNYNGSSFPPKAIVALAYKSRFGVQIETKQFDQGERSKTFKHLKSLGFKIEKRAGELPFRIVLYDVHGDSAIANYETLIDREKAIFLWDDKKFTKLKEGDYVFWVNRSKSEALFTVLTSKSVRPAFGDGKNTIEYNGFTGFANAENADQFENFCGFEIQNLVQIDEFWNYTDLSTFSSQVMAVNLLVENIASKEIAKKIEKLEDLGRLFNESNEVTDIVEKAISFLEERGAAQDSTETSFLEYIKRFDQTELKAYFDMLNRILDELKVEIGDQRLVFNFYNNGLQFTIGQRYSLVYFPNRKDAKFFVAAKKSIGNLGIDKLFSGPPQTYLCRRNEIDFDNSEFESVIEALKIELKENSKSRYRKWNKVDFEKFIFAYSEILASNENEKESPLFSLIESFTKDSANQNLIFSTYLTKRYIASLGTKPFVIFTGLSGSGKTKLAQIFAKWICESDEQYKIIPVGADWTNREPLLGYPNSLDSSKYVLPDNGALDLILAAIENAEGKVLSDCSPYFMILDEMNLSHVERYFADFLSGMESKESISLYTGNERKDENGRAIPKEIKLPPNLFMVGTVNIDETTYMFSPKVLDRANTIEFRVDKKDLEAFFDAPNEESTSAIDGTGAAYSSEFMEFVALENVNRNEFQEQLLRFFKALQPIGAEFGYRTANEMNRLMSQLGLLGLEKKDHALDIAVMQKLLPKLHGSRTKLNKVLPVLASFCFEACSSEQAKTLLDEAKREGQLLSSNTPTLPLSFAKIARMYAAVQENGFASYAEG